MLVFPIESETLHGSRDQGFEGRPALSLVTIDATNCDNPVRVSSSRHLYTFWQQGEVCCCLHIHPFTTQHFVAVCANGRPFMTDNVADADEGARAAERFWALFAEAETPRD